jgi:hypothetical protein
MRLLCDKKKKKKKCVTMKENSGLYRQKKEEVAKQPMYKREEGTKKVFLMCEYGAVCLIQHVLSLLAHSILA